MTEPTTAQGVDVETENAETPESVLRRHVERASLQLRELERIAAGTYGTCTTCREPIAAAW